MVAMTCAQFAREAHYRATLHTAHTLHQLGILTASDVGRIQQELQTVYDPPIGRLDSLAGLDKNGVLRDV